MMLRWLFSILFILNLRRSRCPNLPVYLRNKYGQATLRTYRHLETALKRSQKAQLDLDFLLYCRLNNITPNFVKFKVYRASLYHSEFYHEATRQLLDIEIKSKEKLIIKHKNTCNSLFNVIRDTVSFIDFIYAKSVLANSTNSYSENVQNTHSRKLERLGIQIPKFLNSKSTVFNHSNYVLSKREQFLLSLGLDFCLPNFKPTFSSFYLPLELLFTRLRSLQLPGDLPSLQRDIRNLAQNTFFSKSTTNWLPFFRKDDCQLLKNLSNNPDIIITRPDKGRGTVLLNKNDYVQKMDEILNDTTKFTKIGNPTFQLIFKQEDKINRLLKSFKDENLITESTYQNLYSSGSSYGVLYGLPKIHKENIPLRPILAAYNNPNYQIAKYLVPLLQPYANNQYSLLNSASLVPDILPQDVDLYMVSFDVTSLFTNIPLQATVEIILNKIFYEDDYLFHGLNRSNFQKLLEIAVQDTHFLFNNDIYKQVDGVAMGSPLGPIMANAFMCSLEEQMLDDCPLAYRPLFYRRYVDDTFALFRSREAAENFLQHINSLHPNIRFTIEHEHDNKLAFLDILITRTDQGFTTSVFRKKTFTGQGTNFYSSCASIFRLNSISTLLHRAYTLSSNWQIFHKEIMFLLQYFMNNSYPSLLVNKHIRCFLNDKFQPRQLIPTVPKLVMFASIPFVHSTKFKLHLQMIINNMFPALDIHLISKNPRTLGSLFSFKDKLPALMRSSVVYSFSCPNCKVGKYVGATKRLLKVRIASHLGISHRTGCTLKTKEFSNIRDHCQKCKTSFSEHDFDIVAQAPSNYSLPILESLLIKQLVPSLNSQTSSTILYIT